MGGEIKRKIFFISTGFGASLGGTAVSESSLCQELQKRGEDVLICAPARACDRDFCRQLGLKNVESYRPADWIKAYFLPRHPLRRRLASCTVAHLNGHWRWEFFFVSRLCRKLKIPYVLHPRGMMWVDKKIFRKRIFNFLLGNSIVAHAHSVIALSDYEKQQFVPYRFKTDQSVVVIPNGISEQFLTATDTPETRPEKTSENFFLYYGRIEKRKNLLFLIDAFRKAELPKNYSLLLMGPPQKPYLEIVQKKVADAGLGSRVRWIAPQYAEKKWQLIRASIAVVYPTLQEAFGRVPFEALLVGALPIIPDESGAADYLARWLSPVIYRAQDLDSLAQKLVKVSRLTGEEKNRLTAPGKKWVVDELNWEKIGTRMIDLYRLFERAT